MKKYPNKLFMIQINLGGIHDCVYEMKRDRSLDDIGEGPVWFDKDGDVNFQPNRKSYLPPARQQLVFTSKKEAEAALKGMLLVRLFMSENFFTPERK